MSPSFAASSWEIQPPKARRVEELPIRRGLPETLVGHDVRRYVQRRLNRELERVLDEALLLEIVADAVQASHGRELAEARFDEGEPLRDEVRVGHVAASTGNRR